MLVRFEQIAGASTRVYTAGSSGRAVLLLHGVGMPAEVWLPTIPALAQRYRVFAPDLLGCGFTGNGSYRDGPAHPHMLDHLVALIEHFDLAETAVVGSSLGALLAVLLHLRLGRRIPVLGLVSSGSAFNADAELAAMYQATWKNGRSAYADPSYANCVARMGRILAPGTTAPEGLIFAQMTSYALPGALETFDRRMAGMADLEGWRPWRLQGRLDQVTAAVVAIFGGEDPRADIGQARPQLEQLGAELTVFDRARHYPQLDEPDRFNAVLGSFLARTYPPGT